MTETYTDQDGSMWDWKYAICPQCEQTAKPSHYHFTTMTSFLCPNCGTLYDEPYFEPAEVAYMGQSEGDSDHE